MKDVLDATPEEIKADLQSRKRKKSPAVLIEDAIQKYVALHPPCFCIKVDVKGTNRNGKWHTTKATKGVSDLMVIIKGITYYIEVKAGKDKQRPDQKEFERRVTDAGALYYIVISFSEFKNLFDKLKNGKNADK